MTPNDCIFHLLTRSAKSATRCWKQEVEPFGVTAVQGKVLNFMYGLDDLAASELGELTALDGATLTGVVDRLCAMKLIERQQDENDRRSVRLSLTEEGHGIAQSIHAVMEPANDKFLCDFSEQEVAQLKGLLARL